MPLAERFVHMADRPEGFKFDPPKPLQGCWRTTTLRGAISDQAMVQLRDCIVQAWDGDRDEQEKTANLKNKFSKLAV